ncbi:hypothetical protein [Streptomyces sp. A1547]|uniref:Gram-positive cocci surface proteins LPxTG domain-containing protein n=1 Tax=Streptomyces sp. R33 TaxID=3238629 RepID=A0AB39Y1B0_9ACTN|nr:hypothetical protein [Streptomyces sp. A1547]
MPADLAGLFVPAADDSEPEFTNLASASGIAGLALAYAAFRKRSGTR